MDNCTHPFGSLSVDTGLTGQRGQAIVYHLVCDACESRFPGATGIKLLIESGARDSDLIWKVLQGLGGERPSPVAPPVRPGASAECLHHLAWLKVDGGVIAKGSSGNVTVRCVGCRKSWAMATGLKVFLERMVYERSAIRIAIRELGGSV